MSPVIAAAAVAVSVSIPLFVWSVIGHRAPQQEAIHTNLTRGLVPQRKVERRRMQQLEALAGRLTPASFGARLERQLALAGRPAAWPLRRLMTAKIVLAVAAVLLGVFFVSRSPGGQSLLLALAVSVVAYFVPDLLLYSKGTERQAAIALELPDTLDQMTIAVEAGLGFDSAMARAGQNGKGPLAAELIRTLQDMQVGRSRREAYQALAARTTCRDLQQFVRAVIQADTYGVSISGVLRSQAAEMRVKRRQRAEETAMKIPVKVVFPLMVCILPVLFIALLGPVVLNVMETFG